MDHYDFSIMEKTIFTLNWMDNAPALHKSDSGKTRKVLVFTGLFPNNIWPLHGGFVLQRITHLAKVIGSTSVQVVAPIPYYPPFLGGWRRAYRNVVSTHVLDGLTVYHPRYFMIPKIAMALQGISLFLSMLPVLLRLRARFPFEIIDAHYVYPDGFAAVLLGWVFNVPTVVTARGSDINVLKRFKLIRKLLRFTLSKAHRVITVSHALKETIVSLGIPQEKIAVVPNGVNLDQFFPLPKKVARNKLGFHDLERKFLLSVGHLTPNKGFDLLIKALKLVSKGSNSPLLLIVGHGPYKSTLVRLIAQLNMESSVVLVGAIPHDQLVYYYNAADVMCLASEKEGLPNVILEALSCGRPVVASCVGGIPEVISSPEFGILVQRDVQRLAQALEEALQREWNRLKIREHACKFRWTETAYAVWSIFQNLGAYGTGPQEG